jgi:hypothetical protein
MSREESYDYDPMQERPMILMFALGHHLDVKALLTNNSTDVTMVLLI